DDTSDPVGPEVAPGQLPLRELRRLARLVQAGLLALDLAGVAGEEPLPLQRNAEIRIGLDERAGDSVPNRAGLAARASPVHAHAQVERALDARHLQRRERELTVREPREVRPVR